MHTMWNYVFLGGLYPKKQEPELFKLCRGRLSFAANKHQWNMVEGIERNMNRSITLINTFFIPPFPICRKKVFKKALWQHADNAKDVNVGFLNIRWIRNIWQKNGVYHELKSFLKTHKKSKTAVFVYTMRFSVMKAVVRLKEEGFDFHACLIVPDVPAILSNYGKKKTIASRMASNYNLSHINRYVPKMDSFVLLSEPMKEFVSIENKPYCVVDGLCGDEMITNLPDIHVDFETQKRIVYTGSLHREYGICDLLKEFQSLLGSEFRLIIAGNGNAKEEVEKACLEDSRITYLGSLGPEDVKKLQESATILINPRPLRGVDAKYSFPSKTIEYMLAGKPVIMNRLPGMDPVYEKYVFTPEKCGCHSLGETINYLCSMKAEDVEEIVRSARQFIIDEKNSSAQMKKVIEMLEQQEG